jgi:hypothetical protein
MVAGVSAIDLPVDDPRRPLIRRAVLGTLTLAALFFVLTLPTHRLPTMWVHGPWTVDPYHVVVSFSVPFAALLALTCGLRVPLCRREEPLPVRRVRDLLRGARLIVGVVLLTVIGDWISLPLEQYHYSWALTTIAPLAGLVLLSIVALWTARQVWSAPRQPTGVVQGPDWLADAITLSRRQTRRLGPAQPLAIAALNWADRRVITQVRRHAIALAAASSALFGALVAVSQGVQEGYPAAGYLLFFVVASSGFFAFALLAGSYLGLLGDGHRKQRSRARTTLTRVFAATSASVPVAIAFRTAIWSLLGVPHQTFTWTALDLTVLGVAATTAIVTLVLDRLAQRH